MRWICSCRLGSVGIALRLRAIRRGPPGRDSAAPPSPRRPGTATGPCPSSRATSRAPASAGNAGADVPPRNLAARRAALHVLDPAPLRDVDDDVGRQHRLVAEADLRLSRVEQIASERVVHEPRGA